MRKMRAAALGLLWALLGAPAAAQDTSVAPTSRGGLIYELKIGALAHDVPLTANSKEPLGPDLNLEVVFGPSLDFLFCTIRPALGATVNFAGYTSKAYLDVRWQVECCWGAFFALGIGAAIHNGEEDSLANWKSLTGPALQAALATAENHKQLGSLVLFHPTFEWGYRLNESSSLSIFYEHISNANTAAKNEGLDSLGLRYGYRF
jgi:lipid A 3-O-deacylase